MTDVISNNQSGGINAHNLNITDSFNIKKPSKKNNKKRKIITIIITIIFIIAAVVAILEYIGIKPDDEKMDDEKKDINVISYDQSGGINAYNVNIGNQKRALTPELKSQLNEKITKDKEKTIKITANMGDTESILFATEIKSYLESEGWKVSGINQAMSSGPVIGQSINPEGTEIRIGSNI